ncbi:MAG: hypothetical protein GXX91_14050 [Verrucomicrobiaceae bacterium]|nr:hypothetical protein [Verrucomicrobiaceae bacterium]
MASLYVVCFFQEPPLALESVCHPMNESSHDSAAEVSLPTKQDFDPFGGDLDAQCAWRNFGGLSIADALTRFRENPIHYQEDFMFMGGRAFVFYFPVLDTFLREFRLTGHEDDSHAAIIGSGITAQFGWPTASHLIAIHPAIRSLADYVCSQTHMLAAEPAEQRKIARDWRSVYVSLDSVDGDAPNTIGDTCSRRLIRKSLT